jgi:hypothetical protein
MNDQCVVCQRRVQRTENYLRCHLWGAFATFHWRCFASYLWRESEPTRKHLMASEQPAIELAAQQKPIQEKCI